MKNKSITLNGNWLSQYRGALCGVLAGGPLGLAVASNLFILTPLALLAALGSFWVAGAISGNIMQRLLEH